MVLFARTRFLISKYIDSSIALFSVHVMTLKEPAVNVVGIVIVNAVASNNDAPAADDNHMSGSMTRAMKKLQHS